MVSAAFLWCLGRCARAEWHGSFSLDEMYDFSIPMAKQFPLPFYGAQGGVPGQNGMGRSHWMKCMISVWQNNSHTK